MSQLELDKIDRLILRELCRDAGISRKELGTKTGLSAPGLSKRLDWLRKAHLIARYTIDIDYVRAGLGTRAVVLVRLGEGAKAFEREITKMRNVIGVDRLLGEYDYSLNIVCETNEVLMHLIQDILSIDSVRDATTLLIFGSVKNDGSALFE